MAKKINRLLVVAVFSGVGVLASSWVMDGVPQRRTNAENIATSKVIEQARAGDPAPQYHQRIDNIWRERDFLPRSEEIAVSADVEKVSALAVKFKGGQDQTVYFIVDGKTYKAEPYKPPVDSKKPVGPTKLTP